MKKKKDSYKFISKIFIYIPNLFLLFMNFFSFTNKTFMMYINNYTYKKTTIVEILKKIK